MGFSPSLAIYQVLGATLAQGRDAPDSIPSSGQRPPGRLVWIHVPDTEVLDVILDLITQLSDHDADLWFLLTTKHARPTELPEACMHSFMPVDLRSDMAAFLNNWRPDVIVWTSGQLYPVLTQLATARRIKMVLLDTGSAYEASQRWLLLPGLMRRTLRKFDTILSGDEATSLALIAGGARSENVHTTGVLEQGKAVLPCNESEWTTLAELLSTRPLWCAAEMDIEELGSVLAAHQQALRRSHRLLLIIVPANPLDVQEFQSQLNDSGLSVTQRSDGDEPGPADQIYLADTEDELGLWYRLAPITFMGQTLAGSSRNSPDPFDAAALGSVVLHGPKLAPHQMAYQRLARAGASRKVNHLGELAHAVESLLAPDRAALMAHAAWQISSSGVEVMDTTVEFLAGTVALAELKS